VEGDRLDEDQIALVIRRASELDGQSPPGQPGLDLVLLEEAAVEAGLSRESVRRAVAELRAGTLKPVDDAGRRSRLGPTVVTVGRCVPGPVAAVDDILRRFLRHEQFQLRRDFGASSSWVRRQDVPARVRVSLDKGLHRRLILREADAVEIAVVDEPGGLGMAAGAVGAVVLNMPEALVVVPAAVASGAGAGHLIGSNRYRSTVEELATALEGFLDGVERRRS
jgi:hypothetical protein